MSEIDEIPAVEMRQQMADAYKIALHDGSDLAAQKIADLKPEPVKPDNDMYEIDIRADGSVLIRPKM